MPVLAHLSRAVGKAAQRVPLLTRALGLVWASARSWTISWLGLLLVQGLLPVASVFLVRALVDGLVEAIDDGGGWDAARPLLVLVAALAGVFLAREILEAAAGWVRTHQAERVRDHIAELIQTKSTAIDLGFYEMPEYHDHLYRAQAEAGTRPLQLVENLGSLLQSAITLVAMGAVLVPFGLWVPAVLVLSTLPALYMVLHFSVREHDWRQKTTEQRRKAWYHDWVLTSDEYAAEVRLFDLGRHFRAGYASLRAALRHGHLDLAKRHAIGKLVAGTVGLLTTGLTTGWMVWRTLIRDISLGELTMFYQAFHQGQKLMRSLLENVGHIYADTLFLGELFAFLELQPAITDHDRPVAMPVQVREGIHLDGVSFAYPGSSRTALEGLDLTIRAGEIAAIVGPNGSGKSTLIKLLCRLYDPDAGRITIDGIDLRDLRLKELRSAVAPLFQEPVRFNDTVEENVRMGERGEERESTEVVRAAEAAGADETVLQLRDGYDTLLGTWFRGGTELSVGEWQRIALARAFFRRSPILLLDEPTSAMDSWAERDWLDRFVTLARGRTAVLITHRMSTARCADVVHVLQGGRIVESGSHEELISGDGPYAASWNH